MKVTVWVDGWQQECCGTRFCVGDEVRWHLLSPDHGYLDSMFGPNDVVTVTYHEEHHQGDERPAPNTVGRVTAIRAVQLRYEGERVLHIVPGSATLTVIAASDGPELRWPGFTAYLVDLDMSARL